MDFRNAVDESLVWARGWFDYGGAPWFFYQISIIIGLFLAAKLAASRIEPLLETRARQIKGHPGLLRVAVALLRRTDWVLSRPFCSLPSRILPVREPEALTDPELTYATPTGCSIAFPGALLMARGAF
jgi:hypothetical protein